MLNDSKIYGSAAVLGLVAGMRAMSAPAVISRMARKGDLTLEGSKLSFLNSGGAASAAALLAIGELIGDKLPSTPARTDTVPLIARAVSGGISGAILCSAKKRSPLTGALVGAAAAVAAAYAAYHLRKTIKEELHIPDTLIALGEDALVASTGAFVIRNLYEEQA